MSTRDTARPGIGRLLFTLMAVAALVLGVAGTATAAPLHAAALAATTSSVTVTPSSHVYGTASLVKVSVRDRGNHAAKGSAKFYLDGKLIATWKLDAKGNSAARIPTGTSVGRHNIQVVYVPPAKGATMAGSHGNVGFWVTKTQVKTAVTIPALPIYFGTAPINVHFSGGHVTPATATLWQGTKIIGRLAVRGSGDAFFRPIAKWNAGRQPLVVKYSGNSYNLASSKTIVAATAKAKSTLSLSLPSGLPYQRSSSASVSVTGAGAKPSGTVSLLVDGTSRSSAALSGGRATLSIPALSAGSHTVKAVYAGDINHTGSSASGSRSAASSPCPVSARACVDLTHSLTWLQSGGKITYGPVVMASGRPGYRTNPGTFTIYWRDIDHHSSEFNNAPMPYSQFFDGGIAFHEGSVYVASHGCIHLSPAAAVTYWNSLSVGDEVYVFGYAPY